MSETISPILIEEAKNEDGSTGYILTYPSGARLYQYTLERALTAIAEDITGKKQIVMVL